MAGIGDQGLVGLGGGGMRSKGSSGGEFGSREWQV